MLSAARVVVLVAVLACGAMLGTAGSQATIAHAARPALTGIQPLGLVRCGDVIDQLHAPDAPDRVVFNRVVVPPEALPDPVHLRPGQSPLPYWDKYGLVVRVGRGPVELSVPRAWRKRAAIVWGNSGGEYSVVRVLACGSNPGYPWLAYAGGFYVRRPACVPLIVRAGIDRARLRFGVGSACA